LDPQLLTSNVVLSLSTPFALCHAQFSQPAMNGAMGTLLTNDPTIRGFLSS
jgi:hypothetical protein